MSPSLALAAFQLISTHGKKSIDEITPGDVTQIVKTLGWKDNVTDETVTTIMEVVKATDVNNVADIVQRPDVISKVFTTLQASKTEDVFTKCKFCKAPNFFVMNSDEIRAGRADRTCANCEAQLALGITPD